MIGLAIGILWLAIGVIVLGAILYILFWAVRMFFPIPPNVEKAVWAVFGILILIYLLMAVEGGSLPHPALFR
jgi:hypothetical protein